MVGYCQCYVMKQKQGSWCCCCGWYLFRWEDKDATVVCQQLGYSSGEAVSMAHFGRGIGPILLDNVECNGDETRIADCSHNVWGESDCDHREDAGVICYCKCGSINQLCVDVVNQLWIWIEIVYSSTLKRHKLFRFTVKEYKGTTISNS